jgi:plasmid stabilization system protein ParE
VTAAFTVKFSAAARDDLLRLFDYLLDRAKTPDDLDLAPQAINAVESAALEQLAVAPFLFRKAGQSPFLRELIVPFGATGYVVQYEIEGMTTVNVLAVRHQREDDYH